MRSVEEQKRRIMIEIKKVYWRYKQLNNKQSDDEVEEQLILQLKVKLLILKKDRFRKIYCRFLRKVYRRNEELKEKIEKFIEKSDDCRKKNKILYK